MLKSRNVRVPYENTFFQHGGNGAVDLIVDRAVLAAKIKERNGQRLPSGRNRGLELRMSAHGIFAKLRGV